VSMPFDGTAMQTVRLALYVYFSDGSSAVAEGEELTVHTEMDYGGHMVDIQAVPEIELRTTPVMQLRIYPALGRPTLRVTKRPPIPSA
jgi:hypothetical protein